MALSLEFSLFHRICIPLEHCFLLFFKVKRIFCLKCIVLQTYVFFCVCVSLFYPEYCDCECYCLEADSTVVDMQVMCCS